MRPQIKGKVYGIYFCLSTREKIETLCQPNVICNHQPEDTTDDQAGQKCSRIIGAQSRRYGHANIGAIQANQKPAGDGDCQEAGNDKGYVYSFSG